MASRLLISDANILIDMEVGELANAMFDLPYRFATPAMLFEQELRQHHAHLHAKGLELMELESSGVERMIVLDNKYTGVSSNDLAALVLAEQEQVPLLTGDGKLRQVCFEEKIDVRGTVWLVEQMLEHGVITVDEAREAYRKMEKDGSRLPWEDINRQIKRFTGKAE